MAIKEASIKEICEFISGYSSTLLAGGASTEFTMNVTDRLTRAYKVTCETSIFPMHIYVSVWDEKKESTYSINQKIPSLGLDFARNTRLNKLSKRIERERLSIDDADQLFKEILATPRLKTWVVTALASAANASFCYLFGGDWISMFIVFVATVYGFTLKHLLVKHTKMDIRIITITAACLSAIVASAGYIFQLGGTPDIALATSVLYLVPGIPYINAISDMLSGHHICAISRFFNAAILTVCLSIGLSIGLIIMHFHFM